MESYLCLFYLLLCIQFYLLNFQHLNSQQVSMYSDKQAGDKQPNNLPINRQRRSSSAPLPHDFDFRGNRDFVYNQIPPRDFGPDQWEHNVYCPFSEHYDVETGSGNPCHQHAVKLGPPLKAYVKMERKKKKEMKKCKKYGLCKGY